MIARLIRRLRHDRRGATLLEFALASPILIMFLLGIVQMGMMLHASAGMRHAIGEGARFVKVNPLATQAQVLQVVQDNFSGIDPQQVTRLTLDRGFERNARYAELQMTYVFTLNVPFIPAIPVTLTEERQVYVPPVGGVWPPAA